MKIFTADQIYEADKFTIERQEISSDDLMERAATKIFEWMHSRLQGGQVKIHLFCGIGNNGGDGIALARHLYEHKYDIAVYVVNYSEKRSKDFLVNLDRLKERKLWPEFLDSDCSFPTIRPNDIVVDAIFGIGLNRAPANWVGKLIQHINTSNAFVLSVDIPSGLPSDRVPWDAKSVIEASYVLSFQIPKLVFFLPETGIYQNQWEVLDIGLDPMYFEKTETDFELIGRNEVLSMYKPRLKFSHKGTFGHSVIIGGSHGKIGAVHLACDASLCAGSGLVTAFVPECGYIPLQANLPELMVLTDDSVKSLSQIAIPFKASVYGIGIGMGTANETTEALRAFLRHCDGPLVIDADGLNILSKHPDMLKHIPKETILTPHPKELERLIGTWDDDFEKLEKAKKFSSQYHCILVLKGAHTITFHRGKGYINTTGNPGMATAGSGDVLMGMITGLIAQGYTPLQAAIFGVHLHGLSGDIVASLNGYEAMKASKLVENLGKAYVELLKPPQTENTRED